MADYRAEFERRRRALFNAAMDLPEDQRQTYVEKETPEEVELRNSVLRLLASANEHRRGALDHALYQRQAPAKAEAPQAIGKYTVVRRLGAGGMGAVYCCHLPGSATQVAVKVIHTELQTQGFLQRFERERAILDRLQHPNVCRMLDAGFADHGSPYIVMELVDGEPMASYCQRHSCGLEDRLRLFSQVLAGVAYLHRENVAHRDLKPPNILVTDSGNARILDFGIAKILDHRPGLTGHGPTKTKIPLMTLRYASPEQLQQRLSGRSSDIYSLGLMLYELLTGKHPFEGEHQKGTEELLATLATRRPAQPSRLISTEVAGTARPATLHALDAVLLNTLQFDPAARYGSALQLLTDVRTCLEGRPVEARSAART